jgi:hypothetical protein
MITEPEQAEATYDYRIAIDDHQTAVILRKKAEANRKKNGSSIQS